MLDSTLCLLVKLVGWVLCRLPVSLCVAIGQRLGDLARVLQPKRVWIGRQNLKAAFGKRLSRREADRILREVFRNLGASIIEMLRLPAIDAAYIKRHVEIVDYQHFERAVASERPVVLLTGHFGNWELTSITAALIGHPIVALARAQNTLPKLYHLLVSYRESKGCRVVHKGGAMRQLVRALGQRELVGIVGDQASRHGVFVDFFGRPALFAKGPFELARANGAWVVMAFMHRVRGPFHRLVVEPPLDLAQMSGTPEEIVRTGIERFAGALQRHAEQDPEQWLWVHKRWKRTPARRVLILSDGKLGHVKQSRTVVDAIKEHSADVRDDTVEVRFRNRLARWVATVWARIAPGVAPMTCLRLTLQSDSFRAASMTYADVIVSTGSSTAPVNVLLSRDNRAKSVVVMDPSLPLSAFTLAFVPVHDAVRPRPNVVETHGALGRLDDSSLAAARERLRTHPRFRGDTSANGHAPGSRPVVTVLLGGDTRDYVLTKEFVETIMHATLAVCDERDAECLVTTSRRTPAAVDDWLEREVRPHPRCRLLLIASRDDVAGTMDGLLASASAIVATGESISMISEACASGRPVLAVEPPARRAGRATKASRFLASMESSGYLRRAAPADISASLREALDGRASAKRLDTYAMVRDAVKGLL